MIPLNLKDSFVFVINVKEIELKLFIERKSMNIYT